MVLFRFVQSFVLEMSMMYFGFSRCRFRWRRGLRRGFAAARLSVLRVRIPMDVPLFFFFLNVEYCQVQRSLRRANPSSREVLPECVLASSVIKCNNEQLPATNRKTEVTTKKERKNARKKGRKNENFNTSEK